jgi:hypothetical protein
VIEQVRELSERLALTSQYGQAQVAIVDPADAINRAAANALLKTWKNRAGPLPVAGVGRPDASAGDHPQPLPAAGVPLATAAEALAWLVEQGHAEAQAREALEAARGHPGWPTTGCARRAGAATRRGRDLERIAAGKLGAVKRRSVVRRRTRTCACATPPSWPRARRAGRLDRSRAIAQACRLVRCGQPHPRPAAHHGARRPRGGGIAAGLARCPTRASRAKGMNR